MGTIEYLGEQDIDANIGERRTFTREVKFHLKGVSLPVFLICGYLPRVGSIHPRYPWFVAGDSSIKREIDTHEGCGVTVSTQYRMLKTLEENEDEDEAITANFPWLLPAQDYKTQPIQVEKTIDYLWRNKKWEYSDLRDSLNFTNDTDNNWQKADRKDVSLVRWRKVPFQTTANTPLIGTRQANGLSISFWYYLMHDWFNRDMITEYNGTFNAKEIIIAGETYPSGAVQLEFSSVDEDKWEKPNKAFDKIWKVAVSLKYNPETWNKKYENVDQNFIAYDVKMKAGTPSNETDENTAKEIEFDENGQPKYKDDKNRGVNRIYATAFDPTPDKSEDGCLFQNPDRYVQYFGEKDFCTSLNPAIEPVEITEPMYLDEKGRIIFPDKKTGRVNANLSPKIEGYVEEPKDWARLRLPTRR